MSIGVPKEFDYKGKEDLEGMSIATSYPNLLNSFLKENNINASSHEISGSVEIAPSIGLADAVCDIVSSGSTLISNGLKEVEVIYKSQALLIGSKNLSPAKQAILDQLLFRMRSVMASANTKYITLNAPTDSLDNILALLPGVKSPSIMPLAMEGWHSVHTVIKENEFWEIIEKLRLAGAEGILVLPIEKIIA